MITLLYLSFLLAMYLDAVSNLKSWQDKESHWLSNPVLHSGEGKHQVSVELCHAIGKNPKIPGGAVDQPEFEVKGSKFMFDDKVFKGKQAKSDIIHILKKFTFRTMVNHPRIHSNYDAVTILNRAKSQKKNFPFRMSFQKITLHPSPKNKNLPKVKMREIDLIIRR